MVFEGWDLRMSPECDFDLLSIRDPRVHSEMFSIVNEKSRDTHPLKIAKGGATSFVYGARDARVGQPPLIKSFLS